MNTKTLSFPTAALLLSILLVFSSCKKEDAVSTPDPEVMSSAMSDHQFLSSELISADFRGVVEDENGSPVSDVAINIGNQTVYTDAEGFWQMLDASVDTERAYVRAEKNGYFHGSRVLTPSESGFNRAFITLFSAQIFGQISSETGGTVTHSSGSSVVLPSNGYVDENNTPYQGLVNVQMCYIDPTHADLLEQMPGNLTALETDGDFVALQTYGMLGVELVGSGGQALQLADGSPAEIHVALPTEALSTAPATIDLWHFDEEDGVWRQEGTATLEGNEYVGEVAHFSFWNCDIPTDYVFLEGHLVGMATGIPLQGITVTLYTNDFGQGAAYTDAEGYFGGIIPANVVLGMTLTDQCGNVLLTQNVGPYSSDAALTNIDVNELDSGIGYIIGNLVDCGGVMTEGSVTVNSPSGFPESLVVEPDGSFIIAMPCAPNQVTVVGQSLNYLTESAPVTVTTVANSSVDVGALDMCEIDAETYLVIEIGQDTYQMVDSIYFYSWEEESLYLSAYQNQNNEYLSLQLAMADQPVVAASDFYLGNEQTAWYQDGIQWMPNETNPNINFEFTTYTPNSGDFLEFNFTMTVEEFGNPTNTLDLEGYGRAQRN